uniref:Uncharacterized protein n=1 Tax=Glossina brevipalpis TaxID=37001 RepID=A0A1A9WBA7_9MUSC
MESDMENMLNMSLDDYIQMKKIPKCDKVNPTSGKFARRRRNIDDDEENDQSDDNGEVIFVDTSGDFLKRSKSELNGESSIKYLDCNNSKKELIEKIRHINQGSELSPIQYRLGVPNTSSNRPIDTRTLMSSRFEKNQIKNNGNSFFYKNQNNKSSATRRNQRVTNQNKNNLWAFNDLNSRRLEQLNNLSGSLTKQAAAVADLSNNSAIFMNNINSDVVNAKYVHKPMYDMKIQKVIHEIQGKTLQYNIPGGSLVTNDGIGLNNCKITPSSSGVSLNYRFA